MTDKKFLSIEDCIEASEALHQSIVDQFDMTKFQGLVAILNGGMFPAYWVRKLLKQQGIERPLKIIDVCSYQNYTEQGDISISEKPELENDGEGWVFIDEIVDTGATFEALRALYPKAHFVALTSKTQGKEKADISILSFPQDQWVCFPWEIED